MIFRGYDLINETWVYGAYEQYENYHYIRDYSKIPGNHIFLVEPRSVGFSHDIFDIQGQPIFASIKIDGKFTIGGDVVLIRTPEVETQVHTGNNIPNGSYTEPIGVRIKETVDDVVFDRGVIRLAGEEAPLFWNRVEWELESVLEAIAFPTFPWDENTTREQEIESDIDFLIEEAKVNSREELFSYLSGIRIVEKQWDAEENKNLKPMLFVASLIENHKQKHKKKPSAIEFSEETLNSLMTHSILNSVQNGSINIDYKSSLMGVLIKISNDLEFNQYKLHE